MAIHDYVIANQNGANTRSDLNNAFSAIVSNNSSATEPTTTYAYQWWADTANDLLKQRNAANSAWISILTLSTGAVTSGGDPTMGGDLTGTASNAQIAANAVGLAEMAGGTDGNLITYDASGDPAYVTTGTSGQVLTSGGTGVAPTFQAAAGGADTSLSNLSATGEQMVCKAWVRFVGTGTVAIHDSFNVSSITDVGTGQYTVNLTTAMANANYAAVASCARYWDGDNATTNIVSSSQYTVTTYDQGSTFKDNLAPTSIVFGD